MAASSTQVSVPATTATQLVTGTPTGGDEYSGNTFMLFNYGSVTVGLGGSDISGSNQWRGLLPGAVLILDVGPGETIYGWSASGTGTVDVMRVK